ncbi:hypothetical protein LSAT2_006728, partial [Lamellibrachia satsuma]
GAEEGRGQREDGAEEGRGRGSRQLQWIACRRRYLQKNMRRAELGRE